MSQAWSSAGLRTGHVTIKTVLDINTPSFCQRCRNVSIETLAAGYRLHASCQQLRRAADSGCLLCSVLWHGLLADDEDNVHISSPDEDCVVMILLESEKEHVFTLALLREGVCIKTSTFGLYVPSGEYSTTSLNTQ